MRMQSIFGRSIGPTFQKVIISVSAVGIVAIVLFCDSWNISLAPQAQANSAPYYCAQNEICTAGEVDDGDPATVQCSAACLPIHDNLNWVFLGDSITDAHLYADYLESYFQLRYPQLNLHFRGEGRGGSTIPEATDQGRYDRRVYSWGPDVVSEMFGQNGSFTADQFQAQLTDLTNNYIVAKNGAKPVLFGPHSVYSSTGKASLGLYSDRLVTVGSTQQWPFADIWHYMQPIWASNLASSTPVNLQYGDDAIHPGPSGHLGIAYSLLRGIHADPDVSAVSIDAVAPQILSASHAVVSNLVKTSNGIDFTRLDDRLPMAFDDAAREIFRLMPQVFDMNRYMLTVKNLVPGTYDIYVDGVLSASTTAQTLSDGWNMTAMTQGPIYEQLKEVLGRIRDKEGIDRATRVKTGPPWKGVQAYKSAADYAYNTLAYRGDALKAYLAPKVAAVNNLDALIHAAAQPVARNFSLRKVGPVSCVENWQCGGWSACTGGTQTRSCIDVNACGTTDYMPVSSQSCTLHSICGNGIIEAGEMCDGNNTSCTLNGAPGTQQCNSSCSGWNACVVSPPAAAPPPPPSGNIIAQYLFDGNVADSVGTYSGVNHGGEFVAGKSGQAISFDQSSDYVDLGSGAPITGAKTALSITGWFKMSDTDNTGHEYLLSQSNVLALRRHLNTPDLYFVPCTQNGCVNVIVRSVFTDTNWHHFAVVWDGAVVRVYIDGQDKTPTPKAVTGALVTSTTPLTVSMANSNSLKGAVDELTIWSKALTPAEVSQNYAQ